MIKKVQLDQKWASIRKGLDDVAAGPEQTNQTAEALRELNITQEQDAAIKLISHRTGDQIGILVSSLVEDALILILAGQRPNLLSAYTPPSNTSALKPSSTPLPYKLLKAVEVAKVLDISRTQAYVHMRSGDIPTVRIGKSTRVRPEDLEGFIKANKNKIKIKQYNTFFKIVSLMQPFYSIVIRLWV